MDLLTKLCLIAPFAFYGAIFYKITPKTNLFPSFIVFLFSGVAISFLTLLFYFVSVYVFKFKTGGYSTAVFYGYIFSVSLGGAAEEFIRSQFIVKISKSQSIEIEKNKLNDYILTVGFIFALYESLKIIFSLFSYDVVLLSNFFLQTELSAIEGIRTPSSISASLLLMTGIIIRYYVHIRLLKLSVLALAGRKYFGYSCALIIHFTANLAYSWWAQTDDQAIAIQIVMVGIVVVIVVDLLLRTFKLNY